MTGIVFYEKPGCANNARQKQILKAAGYEIIARDLLCTAWTAAALRAFFGELPVCDWFNRAAPPRKIGGGRAGAARRGRRARADVGRSAADQTPPDGVCGPAHCRLRCPPHRGVAGIAAHRRNTR